MKTPELLAVVFPLRALNSVDEMGYTGIQAQGWFLQELRRLNPDLSAALHDESPEARLPGKPLLRPYTVSPVLRPLAARELASQNEYPFPHRLRPGERAWLRITSLSAELSQFILEEFLPKLPAEIKLGSGYFALEAPSWDTQQHAWAGQDSYDGLLHRAIGADNNYMNLEFLTPTTFQHKRVSKDIPLPNPDSVFGSYLNRWLTFSGARLEDWQAEETFGEYLDECLAVTRLQIRTQRVVFSEKNSSNAATGFVGQVRFSLFGSHKKNRFGAWWQHYANLACMLADFAFYAGTGHRTARGLGQTRRLPD